MPFWVANIVDAKYYYTADFGSKWSLSTGYRSRKRCKNSRSKVQSCNAEHGQIRGTKQNNRNHQPKPSSCQEFCTGNQSRGEFGQETQVLAMHCWNKGKQNAANKGMIKAINQLVHP